MTRTFAFTAATVGALMLGGCAEPVAQTTEVPVATAVATPVAAERALGPEAPPTGELADARLLLQTYSEAEVARRRPDLVSVADAAFDCWDAAAEELAIRGEALACREDFWSAMNALRGADRTRGVVAGR